MPRRPRALVAPALLLLALAGGCARTPLPAARLLPEEEETLGDLQQLTFGGENAEAYWSFDGTQLSLQSRGEGQGCDRIYRMTVLPKPGRPIPVSSGKGATTCAHFFPSGDLLYSSTHLAGDACHHGILAQASPEGLEGVHEEDGFLSGDAWPGRVARDTRLAVASRAVVCQWLASRGVANFGFDRR